MFCNAWTWDVQGNCKATGCGFFGLLTINSNYTVLHSADEWKRELWDDQQ